MKFLTAIDLSSNQLLNARLQNLSAAPTNPTAGLVFYNTTSSAPEVFNGSAWVALDATKATNIPISALATNPLLRSNHSGQQSWGTITGTPTTLSGYGITDGAVLTSPAFTGTPTAPTAAAGTSTTQLATTNFVGTAIANLVSSSPATLDTLNELATALGNDPNFATTMTNSLAAKAPLASPALTGTPTAPTAAPGTSTTQLATTAFVAAAVSGATGALRYSATVGDASATAITVTHNLNTRDVVVNLYETASPYNQVFADIQRSTINSVTLVFSAAPAAGSLRAVIVG